MCEAAHDRRNANIGQHFEGKRRAEHDAGVTAGQIVRQQGERNGGEARACEGDNLRREKPTIRPISEWRRHVHRLPNFPQRLPKPRTRPEVLGMAKRRHGITPSSFSTGRRARERRTKLGHSIEYVRGPRFSVTFLVTYELMAQHGVNRGKQEIVRQRAKHRYHGRDGL